MIENVSVNCPRTVGPRCESAIYIPCRCTSLNPPCPPSPPPLIGTGGKTKGGVAIQASTRINTNITMVIYIIINIGRSWKIMDDHENRALGQELTPHQRGYIIGPIRHGASQREVARAVARARGPVHRTIQVLQERVNGRTMPRSGPSTTYYPARR